MAKTRKKKTDKDAALDEFRVVDDGTTLTTNQGLALENDQDSLKAGERGPSLLEDFHLREKITHFDHERIPERIVHARGSAAHGFFEVYEPIPDLTRARFLNEPGVRTPVFVRFSTVAGSRGSTDLARDVRGFAVKFYTSEGNFDLVGNNMPVFFIQDAVKFPDLVHAVKPEPHHEMPQAASAHDTFWDFISLMPESAHMIMWLMSDRAIPRSYRMMEGFGVHAFRLVDEKGRSRFVKFHWKPVGLGLHAVLWDEAQKISGKDPDFHRRDLWEAIEAGNYPQWELGLQVVEEKDLDELGFDILDPTKLIPEELVPVRRVGRMTLDRNPDNFFAETEQVAFHPGHLVPGIDFSDDPLLQGRLFSYTDTQLLRLGGPNFHEIPINRPVSPVHNNQRDGHMRQAVNVGRVSYSPNSLGGGCPFQAASADGGFKSFVEKMTGPKTRSRSKSFFDHFSQARMFFLSQTEVEQRHIVDALRFELGKVETVEIRRRMVGILSQIDGGLAGKVAAGLGLEVPKPELPMNLSVPADAEAGSRDPKRVPKNVPFSPALSMLSSPGEGIATRKVAVLVADGFDGAAVAKISKALQAAGAMPKIVGPRLGAIRDAADGELVAEFSLLTASSVLFDAVVVAGGDACAAALKGEAKALEFVNEAFKHCKSIATTGAGLDVLVAARVIGALPADAKHAPALPAGVIAGPDAKAARVGADLVEAMASHRHWARELAPPPPA
jgi:catalase